MYKNQEIFSLSYGEYQPENIKMLNNHLKSGKFDINEKEEKVKSTIFLNACFYVNFELIKFCVENGSNVNDYDHIGRNGLMFCMMNPNMKKEIVDYLIDIGVDLNHVDVDNLSVSDYAAYYVDETFRNYIDERKLIKNRLEKLNNLRNC